MTDKNNDSSSTSASRKVYFQLQAGNKLRVYETVSNGKTRQQTTLATLSFGAAPTKELLEQLSTEDKEKLHDYLQLVREQKVYEDVRETLKTLPEVLSQAAHLIEVQKLTLNETTKQTLRDALLEFAKKLK